MILKNTCDYSQPDFYHFSEDSLLLALKALGLWKKMTLPANIHVLDLCAGCGIVGMEFLRQSRADLALDFVEIQKEFVAHLKQNAKAFLTRRQQKQIAFLLSSYSLLKKSAFTKKYHLILCNPPYFCRGRGRPSPSMEKQTCRTWVKGDLAGLLKSVSNALHPDGRALLLQRHPFSMPEELHSSLQIEEIEKKGSVCLILLSGLHKNGG